MPMNKPLQVAPETQGELCSPEFLSVAPTPVFDAFWSFAAERQAIFFQRRALTNPPWTADPILSAFKFTNVYRASDRVSQYLIRNVIYSGDPDPNEVVFRVLLFKLFNRIETWELLEREVGTIHVSKYSVERFDRVLSMALEQGQSIYSGAYIMPSGSRTFQTRRKHLAHLRLLELMLRDKLGQKITDTRSLRDVFQILRSYPLIGNFLAYQYAIDINYSEVTGFSESEFVAPGPGARSGIRKCFSKLNGTTEADVIRLVTDLQEQEFSLRGISFQWLGGRRLQLIDIQNVFCEVDKYARLAFPQAAGLSNRTRIKQRFRPTMGMVDHWYPPKWGVNEKLPPCPPTSPQHTLSCQGSQTSLFV
jgi:hypothetical protein